MPLIYELDDDMQPIGEPDEVGRGHAARSANSLRDSSLSKGAALEPHTHSRGEHGVGAESSVRGEREQHRGSAARRQVRNPEGLLLSQNAKHSRSFRGRFLIDAENKDVEYLANIETITERARDAPESWPESL